MAVTGKQEKTKYRLAESVKECMKAAPVDKITVKNIVEGCGRLKRAVEKLSSDSTYPSSKQ